MFQKKLLMVQKQCVDSVQCDSACLHNEPIGTTSSRVHGDIDLRWKYHYLYYMTILLITVFLFTHIVCVFWLQFNEVEKVQQSLKKEFCVHAYQFSVCIQ